jgi:hypothetical protein
MRLKRAAMVLPFALASTLGAAPTPAPGPPADLLLDGAAVYTMDPARSWAEAVAVRDGRIVFVGTSRDAQAWVGPAPAWSASRDGWSSPASTTPTSTR